MYNTLVNYHAPFDPTEKLALEALLPPPPFQTQEFLSQSILQGPWSGDRMSTRLPPPPPNSVQGEIRMAKQPKSKSSMSLRMARWCYCLSHDIKAPIIGMWRRKYIHRKGREDPPSSPLSAGNSDWLPQLPLLVFLLDVYQLLIWCCYVLSSVGLPQLPLTDILGVLFDAVLLSAALQLTYSFFRASLLYT